MLGNLSNGHSIIKKKKHILKLFLKYVRMMMKNYKSTVIIISIASYLTMYSDFRLHFRDIKIVYSLNLNQSNFH